MQDDVSLPDLDDFFDRQAMHWFGIARQARGMPSSQQLEDFVDLLNEIPLHNEKEDDEGYSLDTRIGWLETSIKESPAHAGYTTVAARDASGEACARAMVRYQNRFEAMSLSDQWDCHIIDAANRVVDPCFSIGPIPLQMFGSGFEVHHAVSDHADDVLLFQFGDGVGVPIDFGKYGVVQLWISPEDLANARFDRVRMSFEI